MTDLMRDCLDSFVRDACDSGDSIEETEIARRYRLLTEVLADFKARSVRLRNMTDNLPRDALYELSAMRIVDAICFYFECRNLRTDIWYYL